MKSSETSAKYSWPRREQKEEIQDSGVPDEVDMTEVFVRVTESVDSDTPGEARLRSSSRGTKDESPLADTVKVGTSRFGVMLSIETPQAPYISGVADSSGAPSLLRVTSYTVRLISFESSSDGVGRSGIEGVRCGSCEGGWSVREMWSRCIIIGAEHVQC